MLKTCYNHEKFDLVENMFIRRTVSKNKKYENEKYYTYRLVA